MNAPTDLRLSVIVPAHDAEATLDEVLAALRASDLHRDVWELIVVDDASSDRTQRIAGVHADLVVSTDGHPRGPAFARNRGAEVARGELLAFVDADVVVHSDALSRMAETLAAGSGVTAVFGSYDAEPRAPGLVSQYRNLLHHYVHSSRPGDADTFWAGIGAVRGSEFFLVGGFDDARYPRPQIEDVELGYRLRARGFRIVLDPGVRGTHLKRWTFLDGVRCDLLDRGLPWVRLVLDRRSVGEGTLNVEPRERVLTLLTALGTVSLAGALVTEMEWLGVAGAVFLLGVLAGNAALLRWFGHVKGPGFALAVVPLRLVYYLLNGLSVAWVLLRRPAAALRLIRFSGARTSPLRRGATGGASRTDVSTDPGTP